MKENDPEVEILLNNFISQKEILSRKIHRVEKYLDYLTGEEQKMDEIELLLLRGKNRREGEYG